MILEIIKSNLSLNGKLTKANRNAEGNTLIWGKNCYIVTQELLLAFSVVYQPTSENQFSISLPEYPWLR